MTISHLVIENLTPALEAGDLSSVQSILSDVSHLKGKHSRESAQCIVNTTVVTCAIQKNQPELVTLLREIPQQSVDSLILNILEQYVATGDKRVDPGARSFIPVPDKEKCAVPDHREVCGIFNFFPVFRTRTPHILQMVLPTSPGFHLRNTVLIALSDLLPVLLNGLRIMTILSCCTRFGISLKK
jgi:hypothetical protein